MKRLLLLSTSTIYGSNYLQYAKDDIKHFFSKSNVNTLLFIPYALPDQDEYYNRVKSAFDEYIGIQVESIHTVHAKQAISKAKAIFVGGGNTFLLLKTLYENDLMDIIKRRVENGELVYMGASAGTNVATVNICTTNDMPIVFPPSFDALNLVSFNINPHYFEGQPDKHMGETRQDRITQYHKMPGSQPVVGLREGSILLLEGKELKLIGPHTVKVFQHDKEPIECDSDTLQPLLKDYL